MDIDADFCSGVTHVSQSEWIGGAIHRGTIERVHHWLGRTKGESYRAIAEMWAHADAGAVTHAPQELPGERFARLANKWSSDTDHISSVTDLINDSSYQQIIDMGMDVVPHLLNDLDRNKRFWFPALAAITGLRPFDPKDMGNYRLMTEAWLRWGRLKGLI
jgi:hypothetical protein